MSLLTTLLFPEHKATTHAVPATVVRVGERDRQGSRPVAMMKAVKVLNEIKKPITLMQLMSLADISRPSANRALKEYAEVVGTTAVKTTRGVKTLKTFRRKT